MRAIFAAALVAAAPLAAQAGEPSFSAEQIISFFASPANSANLGAERGICVGTPEECGVQEQNRSIAAFDLMVNFDLNSDQLSEAAEANLGEFAKALKDPRLSSANFAIEGHTDASGPEDYNQNLSEARAKAVVSFLLQQGVDASRFTVAGYGESKPRTGDPLDGINRRVETRLIQP